MLASSKRDEREMKELVVMGSDYHMIMQDIQEVVCEEPKVGGMEEVMERRLKER